MTVLSYIAAMLLFCFVIASHEFGHFITAKLFGIRVNEFSIGMGPLIYSSKKGETEYSLRALPIGGFCAIEGEDGEGEETERSFGNKPWWQRTIVLAAGAMMNILTCFIILMVVITAVGQASKVLANVSEGLPAWNAGMRPGVEITAIDGEACETWADVCEAIDGSMGREITVTALSGGKDGVTADYSCTPVKGGDGRYIIGIQCALVKNPIKSFSTAISMMGSYSTAIIQWLGTLVKGQASMDEVSGVVGIVSMTAQQARQGLASISLFMAMISLNVGIFNLLPIPALDGGRILFVLIRALSGGRLSAEAEAKVHMIGMILLLGLMVFLVFNDIGRIIN